VLAAEVDRLEGSDGGIPQVMDLGVTGTPALQVLEHDQNGADDIFALRPIRLDAGVVGSACDLA
jgi:hypothetical protein